MSVIYNSNRNRGQFYPDYSSFIDYLDNNKVTPEILSKIIKKHLLNSDFNRSLYDRYRLCEDSIPIFGRSARFDDSEDVINNKLHNTFISEIINQKVGYFAGRPLKYSYSETDESEEVTGSKEGVEEAAKALNDFVTVNSIWKHDMETTRLASIAGYCARIMYIDFEDGKEKIITIPAHEAIILSHNNNLSNPDYAIRYYCVQDINDNTIYKVEFYDDIFVYYFEGGSIDDLNLIKTDIHLFNKCPMWGVMNNDDMTSDIESVLTLVDSYDQVLSDQSNELESFANSYMVFENINITDEERRKAQHSGCFSFFNGNGTGKIYFLTKDLNNTVTENHLTRLEDNIYKFSQSIDFWDNEFYSASGVALEYRLMPLKLKCNTFESQFEMSNRYMFKLLAGSFAKRGIEFDYLQAYTAVRNNFPVDTLAEAQKVQQLISAGLPKKIAFEVLSFVDDIDNVMDMIEEEKDENLERFYSSSLSNKKNDEILEKTSINDDENESEE